MPSKQKNEGKGILLLDFELFIGAYKALFLSLFHLSLLTSHFSLLPSSVLSPKLLIVGCPRFNEPENVPPYGAG